MRNREQHSFKLAALVGRVYSFAFKLLLKFFRLIFAPVKHLHHFIIYAYSLITPPCFYSPGNEFHVSLDDELEAIYLSLEHKQKKIIQHHLEKRKRYKLLLISFVLLLLAFKYHHVAHAGSTTSNLGVTSSVIANCQIYSTNMAFGTYDPTSNTDLYVNGDVVLSCTKNSSATVGMNNGTNSSDASGTTRAMQNTGGGGPKTQYMSYELYKDSGHSSVWSTSNPLNYTATTAGQVTIPLYGRIPQGQNVQTGGYIDTVIVTVNF